MKEFISIKKENILSHEYFEKLHIAPQRVLLWEADSIYARRAYRTIFQLRACNALLAIVVIKALLAIPTGIISAPIVLAFGTGSLLNLAIRGEIRRKSKDTLLGIFYLTETRKLHTIYFDKKRTRTYDIDPSDVKITEG